MEHVEKLKERIEAVRRDYSDENVRAFEDTLRQVVRNGEWVTVTGKDRPNGKFSYDYRTRLGKDYLIFYTNPSEIHHRTATVYDMMITDINCITDTLFAHDDLEGIIINPDSNGMLIKKTDLLSMFFEE